jgi:hypothetical protein
MFKAIYNTIKTAAIFTYHFLFIDQATGQMSNTKFFANVGYIIWCYLFPYAVVVGSKAGMDLWLVFGAVVIGNRTLNVMLQNKAGVAADPDSTWKAVAPKPAAKSAGPAPKLDDLDDK